MILLRILLRILIGFYKDFTNFYGFVKKMVQKNQYTYNVPPGPSDYIYTTRPEGPSPPEGLCRAEPERGPIVFTLHFIGVGRGTGGFNFRGGNPPF